jgi:3-isopropylmalate dehydrogenase
VLRAIEKTSKHTFELTDDLVGGAAIDAFGTAIRKQTISLAKRTDAVLFGAVGGPKWDDPKAAVRPEQAILGLRSALGTFANLRPARMQPSLVHLSPLKPEIVQGADVLFVRELVAGTYFARPKKYWQDARGTWRAVDTTAYTEPQVERTVRMAFELATTRRNRLHVADKQNVMATSRLWRDVATRVSNEFPSVEFQAILADALAMHLLYRPLTFDVIVTDNLFGDLITDEAAALAGSMGLMPSASLGAARNAHGGYRGLYEPIHGTAPDIAGQSKANPIAAIRAWSAHARHRSSRRENRHDERSRRCNCQRRYPRATRLGERLFFANREEASRGFLLASHYRVRICEQQVRVGMECGRLESNPPAGGNKLRTVRLSHRIAEAEFRLPDERAVVLAFRANVHLHPVDT